jgi:hypothetical protein
LKLPPTFPHFLHQLKQPVKAKQVKLPQGFGQFVATLKAATEPPKGR